MARIQPRRTNSSSVDETLIRIKTGAVALGATLLAYFAVAETVACWRPSDEAIAAGAEIFQHEWTENDALAGGGDGLGPVFNASSCVACHFQGGVGGGGSIEHNVRTFEALPTRDRHEIVAGVVHASAISPSLLERADQL